jgi:predicted double-glycine peptidase
MIRFFALASLLFSMVAADAADLTVPAFTGSTPVSKHVASMREMRFAHVVEQKTDYSCGAAALATLLNYGFGIKVSEPEVIAGIMRGADPDTVRRLGFSMLDMKRYVNTLGLSASGFLVPPEMLAALKIPVITLIDADGYKHFVVVKAYTRDWVYLADPAQGNRTVPTETFNRQWSKILLAVVGPGYQANTPLFGPSPVLSARASVDSVRPLPQNGLVEFGYIFSDFF